MNSYKQQIRVNYPMAASQSSVPTLPKSRGHSLFDRQAQLHGHDPTKPSSQNTSYNSRPLPPLKSSYSIATPPMQASSSSAIHQPYSPMPVHRRSPSSTDSYTSSNDNNVQLLSVHPRPESTYIKDLPPPIPRKSSKLLETDFPLYENISREENECTAIVEKAFDYLTTHDDDDDVIHQDSFRDPTYNSDSFDDDDDETGDNIDITTSNQYHQIDSGNHTLSSTGNDDKRDDTNISQEKLNDQQYSMARLSRSRSRTTVSEEYDSDFDDSSHGDEEQLTNKDSIHESEQEQQQQIVLRQKQILCGIVHEWLRKEEFYIEQLKKMMDQLNQIQVPKDFYKYIQQLLEQHKEVYTEIEELYDREHHPSSLTQRLTHTVETLMQTLPVYDDYIRYNLAPIRKALEKRPNTNGLSSEDLLSIPTKQFLQILSQVQDLYQTAQSFESGDTSNIGQLYNQAQRCRLYGTRQDENINNVVLKNEEVVTMSSRGNRDRCRLVLYPDTIVCCYLKAKLLTSPKYTLQWFIPMIDLQWTVPQNSSDDNLDTGDDLKTTIKSYYKELEKTPKTQTSTSSRLTKSIRKQESEFNTAHSKLQLILSSTARTSISSIILFSSAYQRQDWIDLIDKSKQELIQRSSALINQSSYHQRLNDSLIQKRLDLIKPNFHESNSNDSSATIQTMGTAKTYTGTLSIAIHSIHGSALLNPIRQYQTLPIMSSTQQQSLKNYQFYVAIEIDSYNTFYPHAQTSKQSMQQHETVEFKGETFQVELEYSLAFRLLVYRLDISTGNTNSNLQRSTCIGKFHRDIEPALRDCQNSQHGTINLVSQTGDIKVKVSLKYFRRDGTFKRQGSKRSLAIFGKSIEKLLLLPNGTVHDIPRIIVKCIELVERDGLTETGIYRVCCVASDLQKVRHEFDKNCLRGEEILSQKNVHVPANLLKLFFRELPEPIFTSKLYKEFINAIQLTDIDNQRITLLKTFELLDNDNRKILFYLFDHLIRVSQYSHINMMHLENLAVVFGPTLMRPSKLILTTHYSPMNQRSNSVNGQATSTDLDQMSSELQGSMYQCQVVLACLKLRRDGQLK